MTAPTPLPSLPSLDHDRVRRMLGYVDSWIAFRAEYLQVPGVQVAILVGDEIALSSAHGVADVASGEPLTESHLFRIASHSKTFTATAILQLVEQDTVRLDDRIDRWLPDLDGAADEWGAVTIRELLAHGSGTSRDGTDGDFWQGLQPFPDGDGLRSIIAGGVDVLPANDRFKYSNIGYSVLGAIISAASGTPYDQYVTTHVIDRLSLLDTTPELDAERIGDYAAGHTARAFGERRAIEHVDTRAMASATGFSSTARDVVRYASAHFDGDDRLLTDASKRRMRQRQWDVGQGDDGYGLGLAISAIGGRRF